jgi:type VI protein secretion system component VasK
VADKSGGSAGGMVRDVVLYTLARLLLVVALTAAIYYIAQLLGIHQFPLVIAMLFAIVIALPLGIWLLAPLRKRATASIAQVDERRRGDRDELRARLRGEKPTKPED